MAMEADAAHPCSMSNGSLMYKYRATATEYKNTDTKEEDMLTFDSSKRYFTIYVGDYDSLGVDEEICLRFLEGLGKRHSAAHVGLQSQPFQPYTRCLGLYL